MRLLDFRSDTVTQPTPEMREAMAQAPVGDDVMGEDPTINELEEKAAQLMGKDAALFVPTGTMANQLAIWIHTARQGQVLAETNSHIAAFEGGAAALLAGATVRTVDGNRGELTPESLRWHFREDDGHFQQTKLVCVENTHNWAGGTAWAPERLVQVAAMAHKHGARVHLDGARIFNASVAAGLPPTAWTECCDSVMFCLSKGLSAPVGSMLCGDADFIAEARRVRKRLGGGMRQAGILAAAGLVALDQMVVRLADDHATARRLAEGLSALDVLDVAEVETNIVNVDITRTGLTIEHFMELMQEIGILLFPRDVGPVARFVTHRHVTGEDADDAVRRITKVLS